MIRGLFGEALLFFVPFALFALYLVVRQRNPFLWASWSEQTTWLVIAGLGCAILAFIISGVLSLVLLDKQRTAFAQKVETRARPIEEKFDAMRSKEDDA